MKHVLVHGVAYVVAGCFFILATFLTGCQREPVKFYETSASRSDLKDWEGEVLARLDNLDHAHPAVEPAKTLRILAYPGLIHRSHAGGASTTSDATAKTAEQSSIQLSKSIELFSETYDIEVQITDLDHASLEDGVIPAKQLKEFDLVFAPAHWLPRKGAQALFEVVGEKNIEGLTKLRESFQSSFSPVPDILNLTYYIPFFRTTYGLYYNLGEWSTPPESWEECFLFAHEKDSWGKVSYLDEPDSVLSLAGILASNIQGADRTNTISQIDRMLTEVSGLHGTTNATVAGLKAIREEHSESFQQLIEASKKKSDMLFDDTLPPLNKELGEGSLDTGSGTGMSPEDLEFAVRLIKCGLVFGATLKDPQEDPNRTELESWAMALSDSRDAFGTENATHDVHYVIPDEGTLIVVDSLGMVKGRPKNSQAASELLLEFLLLKPVAASLTIFSDRANLVPGSTALMPTAVIHSPVYTLPLRESMRFPPLLAIHQAKEKWAAIVEFEQYLAGLAPH